MEKQQNTERYRSRSRGRRRSKPQYVKVSRGGIRL